MRLTPSAILPCSVSPLSGENSDVAKIAKFVLHKSGPHSFFELVTPEEEILLHSELYRWPGATENAVVAVRESAHDDAHYQRRRSGRSQHYFVLASKVGEVLATSGMHASAAAMEKAIDTVKRAAPRASIEK